MSLVTVPEPDDEAQEPVYDVARKIVAGGSYTDADAERVARAFLELADGRADQ